MDPVASEKTKICEIISNMRNKKNIAVVGNIGSGKSITEDIICAYLTNAVERRSHTPNSTQTPSNVLVSALAESMRPQEMEIRISRSWFDFVYHSRVVFYHTQHPGNFDLRRLSRFYHAAKRVITNPVNFIIWIDTPPILCWENIEDPEVWENISLSQLQILDSVLRKWLSNVDVPIARIDGDATMAIWGSKVADIGRAFRKNLMGLCKPCNDVVEFWRE